MKAGFAFIRVFPVIDNGTTRWYHTTMLEHKGCRGVVEFDYDANIFFGEVADLRAVITFQGRSVEELEQSFRGSVDEYLKFCEELGRDLEKPFSGRFNMRLTPELHRKISIQAKRDNKSLNQWMSESLERVRG